MNYAAIYARIIDRARSRKAPEISEKHHVVFLKNACAYCLNRVEGTSPDFRSAHEALKSELEQKQP